ncbi:hypothetical protein SUGI_0869360 [Cryptomeria japonica]|nr:hypothetical protein SUGI_0869360 [Cryptomeria japonica]
MQKKCRDFHLHWVLATIFAVLVRADDTIDLGPGLTGDQTIASQNGQFELGFFSPGSNNKWYIGIWYAQITPRTVVWVANREQPVSSFAALKFTENGTLAVLEANNNPVWETGNLLRASRAVILDSGNLVLLADDSSNRNDSKKGKKHASDIVVWESFDNPADTWLPGMKISYGKLLTSWKTLTNPAPGDFSLRLNLEESGSNSGKFSEFQLVWRNSFPYWSSGKWIGNSFMFIPEMTVKYIYNFSFVNPNSSDGRSCLDNCSCIGYAYREGFKECRMLWGDLWNLRNCSADDDNDSGTTSDSTCTRNSALVYVRIAACDLPKKDFPKRKVSPGVLIGALSGFGAFTIIVFLNFLCWKHWKKAKNTAESFHGTTLTMFTYKDLQIATRNFSEKLGSGGFGSVYKGVLSGSIPIAVKKLERPEGGEKQFRMEVSTIGTIQHVNLVRLRGFCSEGGRRNIETSNVESEKWFFPPWAAKQVSVGNILELVDNHLAMGIDEEEVRRAAMVAIWCIQDDEDSRPTMGTIVKMLEGILDVSTPPIPRTLQALMDENRVSQTMTVDSEMDSPVSSPSSIVVVNASKDLESS